MRIHNNRLQRVHFFDVLIHLFFVLLCACFVIPMMVIISASLSSEDAIIHTGFGVLPREFTLDAYKSAFAYGSNRMIRAYAVTAGQAFLGTFVACLSAGLAAYPLSRSNFKFRKPITGFLLFTMLIGPSMIPNYIVLSKYYKLADTFWIYILPGIVGGAWNTFVFRTFFKGLPESLFESAYLDGAGELRIFFQIVVPLSTPIFATMAFMMLVGKWNDYGTSMIYIRNENLYTLQYLLERVSTQAEFIKQMATNTQFGGSITLNANSLPTETFKFAMCILAAGPMLVVFPFFQKYFAKGLVVGSVKG